MSSSINSFKDSKAYIIHSKANFSYSFYYNNFCLGLTREQVETKFENEINDIISSGDAMDSMTANWVEEQQNLSFPVMKTEEVDSFWLIEAEKKNYFNTLQRESCYEKSIHNFYMNTRNSKAKGKGKELATIPPIELSEENVVEGDSLIIFDNRSVASTLKSYGLKLFKNYHILSIQDQALCGFCLNGILDLTNQTENGQKRLFSKEQWEYLNKHIGSKEGKHLKPLSQVTQAKLEDMAKQIKKNNSEEAYYVSLEHIRYAHPEDKCIFKILSHVINAYRERKYIFINPVKKISELDFLMKIWGEVFELLFGDRDDIVVNWGETVPSATTAIKRTNNNNKPHTIGCKVDGRVVCNVSKLVDACHIEAAKGSSDADKLSSDKFKLAVESKCGIDDVVSSGNLATQKHFELHNFQIFGLEGEACTLKLVDRGFYVYTMAHNLSFPNNLECFSDNLVVWVKKLIRFKKLCLNAASQSSQAFYTQQQSLASIFQRDDASNTNIKYCNPSWITGTFLPPTISTKAVVPTSIITGSLVSRNKYVGNKFPSVTLNDGTIVRSKFSREKKKRGASSGDVEDSTTAKNIKKRK